MAVSLTHLGEALVARMANALRADFLDLCGLLGGADLDVAAGAGPIAHVEVPLLPYSGKGFDGLSRVDLVVLLDRELGVPFEIKLGNTGLNKSRVARWLDRCELSHGDTRIKGNMMSILERNFPDGLPRDDLKVRLEPDRYVKLTEKWFVIASKNVLDGWSGTARPAFSSRARLLDFESVVDRFGGKERFNDMVQDLLSFDYYDEWINAACRQRPARLNAAP